MTRKHRPLDPEQLTRLADAARAADATTRLGSRPAATSTPDAAADQTDAGRPTPEPAPPLYQYAAEAEAADAAARGRDSEWKGERDGGAGWPDGGIGRDQPPPAELLALLTGLGVDVAALLPGTTVGQASNVQLVHALLDHAAHLSRLADTLRALGVAWAREFVGPQPIPWPALADAAQRGMSTLKDLAPTHTEIAHLELLTGRASAHSRLLQDMRIPTETIAPVGLEALLSIIQSGGTGKTTATVGPETVGGPGESPAHPADLDPPQPLPRTDAVAEDVPGDRDTGRTPTDPAPGPGGL